MKKIIISITGLALTVIPVATVLSCSSGTNPSTSKTPWKPLTPSTPKTPWKPLTPSTKLIDVSEANNALENIDPSISGQSASGTFIAPTWNIANTVLLYGQSSNNTTPPAAYSTNVLNNLENGKYLWVSSRANPHYKFKGEIIPKKIKISGLAPNPVNDYKENILNRLGSNKEAQIKEGLNEIKAKAKAKIIINGNKNYDYTLPNFAIFSGENGDANLTTNFTSNDPTMDSNFKITYYSAPPNSKDFKNNTVNHGSNKTNWNVKEGDQVYVKIVPNNPNKLINGQSTIVHKFRVSGLEKPTAGSSYYKYYVGSDSTKIAYKHLANKNATYSDIFSLMNLMKPGEVISKGSYKMKMPNISPLLVHPAKAKIPASAAIPFIDMSMAGTSTKITPYDKYKYLSFAFLSGKSVNNVRSMEWGGQSHLDYGPIINAMNEIRQNGGDFVPSIGGESATNSFWENADPIIAARVIELLAKQYHLQRIDYDIEGGQLASKSIPIYAAATALAQKKLAAEGQKLEVTLTIAAEYNGLAIDGVHCLNDFVSAGVNITKLNGMTMMMNQKYDEKYGLDGAVKNSITCMKNQVQKAYANNGLTLTDAQAYQKIGTTFDLSSDAKVYEYFTIDKLKSILKFARENKIGQLAYWSVGSEDPDIDGMPMATKEWSGIATGLNIPISGKSLKEIQSAVIAKCGGLPPAYSVYKDFNTTTVVSKDTIIPNDDSKILYSVNKYANGNSSGVNVFNSINFDYPSFSDAMVKYPNGIPEGVKIVTSGLGDIPHIFEAKWNSTKPPWPPATSASWTDLGIALSSADYTNTLAIAQTLVDTYSSATPIYVRYQNADKSFNTKPQPKGEDVPFDTVFNILQGDVVSNIKEWAAKAEDPSRNLYTTGEQTYIDNKVFTAKWNTGGSNPDSSPIPSQWDPNYIPLN